MKYLSLTFLLIISLFAIGQTYPYSESFTLQISNQVPTGWGGGMKVRLAHGTNDSKALVGELSSTNLVDSAISPLIGPLTSSSALSFFYRLINQTNYPSTPTVLSATDTLEIFISNDGVNYQSVMLIDANTHQSTFNFRKKTAFLSAYAGDTVRFKFQCRLGTASRYFVDIDSIQVKDEVNSISEQANESSYFSFFPNPLDNTTARQLHFSVSQKLLGKKLTVSDIHGREILATVVEDSQFTIPTNEWPDGMYVLRVAGISKRLVVQ